MIWKGVSCVEAPKTLAGLAESAFEESSLLSEPCFFDPRLHNRRESSADLSECGVLVADAKESQRSLQSGERIHAERFDGRRRRGDSAIGSKRIVRQTKEKARNGRNVARFLSGLWELLG